MEQYVYDPAGNILKKFVNGEITTYTYDKSNQLVSSTYSGGDGSPKTTTFEYDAAGRLVKEGAKTYTYGWLDKVMSITQNGKVSNSYTYSISGQIASANTAGKTESFIWDGLALIKRGNTEYVYEPAVTGGNPILANGKSMFNDMLGNTLGVINGKDKFTSIKRDAFGQTLANSAGSQYNMFTGKPQIEGLGYAFLFRNYRPNLGKWQTQDPLGYPDGWNNFAYGNNAVTSGVDYQGTDWTLTSTTGSLPNSHDITDTSTMGSGSTLEHHHVIEIFRSLGSPTVTGSAPTNPSNGATYTSTSTYAITVSTYDYTYLENPASGAKSGYTTPSIVVTTTSATIAKTYTYSE